MESFILPDSKVTIEISPEFSREQFADLTRNLLVDENLAKDFRANPLPYLKDVGVIVTGDDLKKITDEDLLVAFGHRESEAEAAIAMPAVRIVARVAIGVLNRPSPAE